MSTSGLMETLAFHRSAQGKPGTMPELSVKQEGHARRRSLGSIRADRGPFRGCIACLPDSSEAGQPVPLIRAWPRLIDPIRIPHDAVVVSGRQFVDTLPEGRHLRCDEFAPGSRVPEFRTDSSPHNQQFAARIDAEKLAKSLGDNQPAPASKTNHPLPGRKEPAEFLNLIDPLAEPTGNKLAAQHIDCSVESRLPGRRIPEGEAATPLLGEHEFLSSRSQRFEKFRRQADPISLVERPRKLSDQQVGRHCHCCS